MPPKAKGQVVVVFVVVVVVVVVVLSVCDIPSSLLLIYEVKMLLFLHIKGVTSFIVL